MMNNTIYLFQIWVGVVQMHGWSSSNACSSKCLHLNYSNHAFSLHRHVAGTSLALLTCCDHIAAQHQLETECSTYSECYTTMIGVLLASARTLLLPYSATSGLRSVVLGALVCKWLVIYVSTSDENNMSLGIMYNQCKCTSSMAHPYLITSATLMYEWIVKKTDHAPP